MMGYMNGGPDVLETRWVADALGMEMQVPIYDGTFTLFHVWVPTTQVMTDLANGQYRIWQYFGKVYRDGSVHPRREDKVQAEIRLKWWKVEDLMEELGLEQEIKLVPSTNYVEAQILVKDSDDYLVVAEEEVECY